MSGFIRLILIAILFLLNPYLGMMPVNTLAADVSQANVSDKIEAGLIDHLRRGSQDVIVECNVAPDFSGVDGLSWQARGRLVHDILLKSVVAAQVGVIRLIEDNPQAYGSYRQHFASAAISIQGLTEPDLVNALAKDANVSYIRATRTMSVVAPVKREAVDRPTALPWGLTDLNLPDIWAAGIDGTGIVIGSVDTGVRYTHEMLIDRYRGNHNGVFDHNYNWWDACTGSKIPVDTDDVVAHGTHTTGTMVGSGADLTIGVAPGAQWIACNALGSGESSETTVLTCLDWMTAPWPLDGTGIVDGDPDRRPHIVSNSWGTITPSDAYHQAVVTWRAAGMFPTFAAGNNGPKCQSLDYPAAYPEAYAVGAYDSFHGIAPFAARGPVWDTPEKIKPSVTAPGVNVISANNASDSAYLLLGGTSQATPHVAGVVALLWSARPWLIGHVDLAERMLENTADPMFDSSCGTATRERALDGSPNMVWGYGRVDPAAALSYTENECFIDPTRQALTGQNGESIGYEFTVYNRSATDLTVALKLGPHNWAARLSATELTVAAGGSKTFVLTHTIPSSPMQQEESVSITASSTLGLATVEVSTRTGSYHYCDCPYETTVILSESFKDGFPPSGWTVVNDDGQRKDGWQSSNTLGRENKTGGAGPCALADSINWYTPMNSSLVSPPIDLSRFTPGTEITLEYKTILNLSFNQGVADVDVSPDNGVTWENVKRYTENTYPATGTTEHIALSAYAGTGLLIRFHFNNPGLGDWEVDDVTVLVCQPAEDQTIICPDKAALCPGSAERTLHIYNFTGASQIYDLSYTLSQGRLSGPAAVGPVAAGESTKIDVTLNLPYIDRGSRIDGAVLAVSRGSGREIYGQVQYQVGGWISGESAPFSAYLNPVVEYNGKIYAFGGGDTAGRVAVYDPETDTWSEGEELASEVIAKPTCGIVGVNPKGDDTVTFYPTDKGEDFFNIYNLTTGVWSISEIDDVNRLGRSACVSDPINNVGYMIGYSASGYHTNFRRLHPDTLEMEELPDSSINRYSPAAWLWRDMICIAGGTTLQDSRDGGLADTECFDPTTGAWRGVNTDLPALPYPWFGGSYGLLDGEPVIAQGVAGTHSTSAGIRYDADTNEWRTLPPAQWPVCMGGGAVHAHRYYAVGGWRQDKAAAFNQIYMNCGATPDGLTISGVTTSTAGEPLAGVVLNGFPETVTTNENGAYAAIVPFGWSGTITPVKDYWRFNPADRSFVDLNYAPEGQDFAATDLTGVVSGGSGGCFIQTAE